MKTKRFGKSDPDSFGLESGDAWVQFSSSENGVFVHGECVLTMTPAQARDLAKWLMRAVEKIEKEASE